MRLRRRLFAPIGILVTLLIALTTLFQPVAAQTAGQASSPQMAGESTVEFSDVWVYDTESSDAETVFLTHQDLQGTAFIYAHVADTISEPEVALDQFTEGFFGEFGAGNQQVVASGTVQQATGWRLYAVDQSGIPFGVMVTANTTSFPGVVELSVLVSPAGSIDLAVTSVQDGVTVDGGGTPLQSFAPQDVTGALEGGQAPTGQSTPVATPSPESERGDLTLPPVEGETTPAEGGSTASQSELVVSTASIMYPDTWTYMEEISTPDEIAFFNSSAAPGALFAYATVGDTTGDVDASLQEFNNGFFSTFGATNVQQVTQDVLPSGLAYSLYTADQNGEPIVVLAYADVTTVPGEFRVQMVISPAAEFESVVTDVKQNFTVDNVGALADLEPAQLSSLLDGGGTTAPSTPVSGQQVPPETSEAGQAGGGSLTVSGDTSRFEAQDAQGSCDAIGWAVTSPDQLPTAESDVNYRSSCVGGAVYFAACGTVSGDDFFAPEPGMVWVRCDVTARVDGEPMELFFLDFTLQDANGAEYTFDLMGHASQTDLPEFPEGPVATGETARAGVVFSVPQDAPGPWVIKVFPTTLIVSGEDPGSIVLAGDIQPFEVFEQ